MGDIKTLSIDIETFSSEDLSKSGVYRYAEAPDFRILLFGYSVNGGPVQVEDISSGGMLPMEILKALTDISVEKNAFNASFERVCLSRLLRDMRWLKEGEFLSPKGWRCTMIRCAYLGLPLSLASAGAALGLDKQKLTEGKDLIRYFCMPAKPSLLNDRGESLMTAGGRNLIRDEVNRPRWGAAPIEVAARNLPSTDPEKWKRFVEYNIRDVEVEMQIQERLKNYPVPETVWEEYELDQEINDRGIAIDSRLVSAALAMDEMARDELTSELSARTALANPNSVSQVRRWLTDHGTEVESLGKKEVAALLKDADPEIREVLLLRQQLAKSSVKKYEAIRNMVCQDGRVRGAFQFYGANRSGRWAGRGVQLQNLPQNHLPDLDKAREAVLSGDYGRVKMLYDSVPDVLSELVRTAFVPASGRFIVADFSAIEARVIAWLAGEEWRMKVFAEGGDIYCASASQMFHVPVEKHGVNSHLRQKGKIAELALGYGGSVGALKSMGALEMGVPEEELKPLVTAWRKANPNICRLWWDVDNAVKAVIQEKTTVHLGRLIFKYRSGMLFIVLPSGRVLSYVRPHLTMNHRFGSPSVAYQGVNAAKKWDWIESYGPKFIENVVQGISRDLLCAAMLCLRDRRIVAHVHDELIIEADPEDTVEEVCRIMAECPPWADGLILRADGYTCEQYRKD